MVATACGGGSDDDSAEGTTTTDSSSSSDADKPTASGDPAEVATDFGVTDDTIRIGINGDLSGPFATLVNEVVAAQKVFWDKVNDDGGIAGRQVELVVLDSGYATDKGIENYQELAQETDEGVLMISENSGSPITAAIAQDAIDDDMLLVPLTWASLWPDNEGIGRNVLEIQTTYCAEAMNGVSWLKDKVEADGREAKLAIMSRPGEYGADGAAGAAIAAEELGIEVVYDGTDQVAGDDRTAVVSQLVDSGATMVWLTTTPGETADMFGSAVSQGFDAAWSGNQPSFSYSVLLGGDLAADFDKYYWPSDYAVPWGGNDSEGMQEVMAAMIAADPEAQLSNSYVRGWVEGLLVKTVLDQAAANGDLTRAGVVAASTQVEFDFKGLSPNQTYDGTYDEILVRESYIFDVDATAFDLQAVGTGEGSTGLIIEDGPYTSDLLRDYQFGGPCI